MYRPVLVTPPSNPPVTADEARSRLRIDSSAENSLIEALITAATAHLDGWTGILGRCVVSQTWRQDFDSFSGCRRLRLPLFPVISITSVMYDDVNDAEQTISASNYSLLSDALGSYVRFKDAFAIPSVHDDPPAVRVTYVAGHAADSAEMAVIKHAILLMVGHWFENREEVVVGPSIDVRQLPLGAAALLEPLRRVRF
jgi:uncharacterized phiE125 gp8 family phage protein